MLSIALYFFRLPPGPKLCIIPSTRPMTYWADENMFPMTNIVEILPPKSGPNVRAIITKRETGKGKYTLMYD